MRASETTEDPRGPIKLDDYGNPTADFLKLPPYTRDYPPARP